jgi:putative SOS response-associated peptidase YedK
MPGAGALMCNDYGNRIPYSAYLEAFSQLKIRLFAPGGAPNLEPRDDIWPTDVAPVIRAHERRRGACPAALGISAWTAEGATGHQYAI